MLDDFIQHIAGVGFFIPETIKTETAPEIIHCGMIPDRNSLTLLPQRGKFILKIVAWPVR